VTLIGRLLAGAGVETRSAPPSGLALPQQWLADALGSSPSPAGKRVSVKSSIGLAPVWAAVSMISEQVGQLPLKVYRRYEDAEGDSERVEARQHRMWPVLHDKPNNHTPADRFWSAVAAQLLLYGNSFIEKRRSDGLTVDELFLLDPQRMTVGYDPDAGTKQFIFEPWNRPRQILSDYEVLHVFGMSLDGLIGLSVVQNCRAALGAALARDEFEGMFYAQGANLSGVLKHPNKLSREAADNLKDSFQALYGGSGKAHGTPVLEEGMEFVQVGSPLKDLEFVASQNLTQTIVATLFKLPPNYLGGSSGDSLTYSTVESNQTHFALHAIQPLTSTIAKALSTDPGILPQNVFECEFVLEAMMRGDANARADFYTKMKALGALTADEIRARENLPALTDAQKQDTAPPTTERITVADQQQPGAVLPVTGVPVVNGNGRAALPSAN
jgi:HK97 family phage portal protein